MDIAMFGITSDTKFVIKIGLILDVLLDSIFLSAKL